MAKQFDDSIAVFARPEGGALMLLPLGIALALLSIGVVYAVVAEQIALAVMLAVAASGVGLGLFLVSQERRKTATLNGGALTWDTALPEIQRETLHGEVIALSKILDVSADQLNDLQSAYVVAEDLALRQVQQEESVPVMRHAAVFGIPFDAVMFKNHVIVCADVLFLVTPDVRQEKVDAAIRKMTTVKKSLADGLEARLMLVLVTQLTPEDEQTLRSGLKTKRFSETPVDIDIRLLDFEALQRIYVTD